mmetsp:Transcript_44254/g.112970  ORF Transcript_44254/g.112970 Transcript_44254/m.112970 type:complete len:215 (-) Transcript_44254:592-1236(-)
MDGYTPFDTDAACTSVRQHHGSTAGAFFSAGCQAGMGGVSSTERVDGRVYDPAAPARTVYLISSPLQAGAAPPARSHSAGSRHASTTSRHSCCRAGAAACSAAASSLARALTYSSTSASGLVSGCVPHSTATPRPTEHASAAGASERSGYVASTLTPGKRASMAGHGSGLSGVWPGSAKSGPPLTRSCVSCHVSASPVAGRKRSGTTAAPSRPR